MDFLSCRGGREGVLLLFLFCVLILLVEGDKIVDTEDGDGSFGGKLDQLNLTHGGFDHASLDAVSDLSLFEIESAFGKCGLCWIGLCEVVYGTEFGDCVAESSGGKEYGG